MRRLLFLARCLVGAALLSGCVAPTPPPSPPPDPAQLEALLNDATIARETGRLDKPVDASALAAYRSVLSLDPENTVANLGLDDLADIFVGNAAEAMSYQDWQGAHGWLARAANVRPDAPAISALKLQLATLSAAKRESLVFTLAQVRQRAPAVAAALLEFGTAARATSARVSIRAASDADGRWMYQQMSKAPGDSRIRSELMIGSPPRVELIFVRPPRDTTEIATERAPKSSAATIRPPIIPPSTQRSQGDPG